MATILYTDGTEEELTDLTLENLQKAVGGWIEAVGLNDGRLIYVNDEGLLMGLPINRKATELVWNVNGPVSYPIVGNVVLLTEAETRKEMESE